MNKIQLHATTWLPLRKMILNESSQAQKRMHSTKFNLHKVQKQTKLIYNVRIQNSAFLYRGYYLVLVPRVMFCFLFWVLVTCLYSLGENSLGSILMICVFFSIDYALAKS